MNRTFRDVIYIHCDPHDTSRRSQAIVRDWPPEGPPERAAHFVAVAKQYAEILAADELEQEIAALERKLTEARAARQLRSIRTELERVVREFPDTEAAKAATRMLQQQSGEDAPLFENPALVPQYSDPSPFRRGGEDVLLPSPAKR